MPIVAGDLKFKLSINTSPGNANAQADPNDSIGGYMSSTEITTATDNNLFDDISGAENAASTVDYRGLFIHNDHATLDLTTATVWISAEVSGGADVDIALDGTGETPEGQAGTPQMERVADELTAPSGETFSHPTTQGTGLSLGDFGANSAYGIWVRRTAADSAALAADGFTLSIGGDTAA
jgi:hypothetical protein